MGGNDIIVSTTKANISNIRGVVPLAFYMRGSISG